MGRSARREEPSSAELRLRDPARPSVVYEVQVRGEEPREFTSLIPASKSGGNRQKACHEVVAGSATVCPGCPALISARGPGSRREAAVIPSPQGAYRVAFAEPIGSGRFRMHMVQLSDAIVATLQRLRIDRRARAAGLSRRELGVLDLLLLGRTSAEIAQALGITERTARFHVGNILRKLEADSRADLLRLLL